MVSDWYIQGERLCISINAVSRDSLLQLHRQVNVHLSQSSGKYNRRRQICLRGGTKW